MAWTLRKTRKIGPFRISLSKTGIGISAGVKGARVGRSPNGDLYSTVGGAGLHKRSVLKKGSRRRSGKPALAASSAIGWIVAAVLAIALVAVLLGRA